MKRVLVAGATGYLGGFVCKEFKDRGYFVRALGRSSKRLDGLWGSTDEIVEELGVVAEDVVDEDRPGVGAETDI